MFFRKVIMIDYGVMEIVEENVLWWDVFGMWLSYMLNIFYYGLGFDYFCFFIVFVYEL